MTTIPTSHRAAILPAARSKHVIEDRATPSIGPDELLIKVTATAINPVDWKIRDYGIFIYTYPAVLGSDAAGTVAAVGSNFSSQYKPGERVFFQGIIGNYDNSTFQQYTKMPAALVARTPSKITDDEAAGVSLATVAAVTALYDSTGQGLTPPWAEGGSQIGAGKAAIVLGGSSSVGQYATQCARLSGFERIVTNSSAAHQAHLQSLGATTVLDRSKATAQDFKDAIGGLSADFVMDSISNKSTQILAVQILQLLDGGNVITVMGADEEAVKLGEVSGQKAVKIKQVIGMGSNPALRHLSEPLFKALGGEDGWVATGKFGTNRPEVVPGGLQGLEDALEKNKQGVSGVKLVIHPNEN